GMLKAAIGRNNWNGFEYHGDGDLCVKLIMVETRSPTEENNREEVGYIPALDHGWHLAPKAEEDNHHADWARTRERTGVWLDRLQLSAGLTGLRPMAVFYSDDPDASLRLRADHQWLMGSTVYGDGPHVLEVEVGHRTRNASVTRVELVTLGGEVVAVHAGGHTPLHVDFEVDPATDAYYFARVELENADTRLLSAPIFVDR